MTYTEEQYNDVLRSTAAELQALKIAHAEAIAAKDEMISALQALKTEMIQKVTAALQSEDRAAQFTALAVEFLTPEQERIRAEKLAQLEALKAELGIE